MYCWVLDALGRRLGRIGKLTRTRGTLYSLLTSSALSMGMGTHTRYAFDFDWANILTMLWNYLMKSNIFCLGFPFLQLGRKKKHEKRCEIGKSVLRSHVLMVRISSSLCEKKKKWWYFFLFQKPQCQPDHAVIFKDICWAVIPGETVSGPCTKTWRITGWSYHKIFKFLAHRKTSKKQNPFQR